MARSKTRVDKQASRRDRSPLIYPTRIRDIDIKYKQDYPYYKKKNGRRGRLFGEAEPDAKKIWVRDQMRTDSKISTLIHEVLHVDFPDASERWVRRVEKSVMSVIRELGRLNGWWRRQGT